MPSLFAKAALVGAFASSALAHGTVSGFLTDDTYNEGFHLEMYYQLQQGQTPAEHFGWYAEDLDNGFVEPNSYASDDIICHKNAKPGDAKTASIEAGGKVSFQWTTWPESHIGPVITYVANCNGECADVDKTALKWVKIDAGGYDTSSQKWATDKMIANNNTWVATVPSTLAAGNYVFRHEIIALHSAGQENGAQNYPQCMNIAVTGSGTENPEGVLGTELYKPDDAGILFNAYTTITNYEMPGPALFGEGSGSGSGSSNSTAPASSAAPSSAAATSAAPTPVVSDAPTVTLSSVTVITAAATTVVTATPAASTGAAATPTSVSGSLPKEFTLDTFITWLKDQGKSSGVARRHARQF